MAEYNIANNQVYKWTSTTGSYLDEVPRIFAKSYQPKSNDILKSVESWVSNIVAKNYKEFYNNLHPSAEAKDQWVFPYFDDTVRDFTNEWGDNRVDSTSTKVQGYLSQSIDSTFGDFAARFSAAVLEGKSLLKDIKGALEGGVGSMSNSILLEPPKFYQYGNSDSSVTIDFPLINTVDGSDSQKNYDLVKQLISNNRFQRVDGGILANSPYLWSVIIPGYRAIRWASCDVSVALVGKRKYINNRLEPEGYRVKLTFKSLYTEPRNFMEDTGLQYFS